MRPRPPGPARSWLAESEAWPWFRFVQIGYDLESGAPAGEAWTAQVAVSIPLFSQNRSGIEEARAEHLRAELVFDATVMARKTALNQSAATPSALSRIDPPLLVRTDPQRFR